MRHRPNSVRSRRSRTQPRSPVHKEATMTPATQSSNGSTNATTPPGRSGQKVRLDTIVGARGGVRRAAGARAARGAARALDAGDRHGFQRYLATEFQPDTAALRIAAECYLADTTAEAAAALAQAADPPRQELLRRINMAPGGTGTLIAMRSEITAHLRHE